MDDKLSKQCKFLSDLFLIITFAAIGACGLFAAVSYSSKDESYIGVIISIIVAGCSVEISKHFYSRFLEEHEKEKK